jgi:hypothetical protein
LTTPSLQFSQPSEAALASGSAAPQYNGQATCTFGKNGIGQCGVDVNGNCIYTVTHSGQNAGTAECVYHWDYSSFRYDQNIDDLIAWVTDIAQNTGPSIVSGFNSPAKWRFVAGHFMFAFLYDTLSQLYMTDSYSNGITNISNIDIISDWLNMVSVRVQLFANAFSDVFSAVGGINNLDTVLTTVITQPTISNNNGTYTIQMPLNLSQYLTWNASSKISPDNFLSNCLSALLRDVQGIFYNINTGETASGTNPVLVNSRLLNITAINLTDQSYNPMVQAMTVQSVNDLNNPPYVTQAMGAVFNIVADIQTWSPMLLILAASQNVVFSTSDCQNIFTSTSLLPVSCLYSLCPSTGSSQTCGTILETICPIRYTPPQYLPRGLALNFLGSNLSPVCTCFSSLLAPYGTPSGNTTAMCFDNTCPASLRSLFGLTDSICRDQCSNVLNWLDSSDPSTQPQFTERLDTTRLAQLCGVNYVPYQGATWNNSILVSGLGFTILFSALAFSIARHGDMSTTFVAVITCLAGLFVLALTLFLARDLAGISRCDGNTPVCHSSITGLRIPNQFCSVVVNCECSLDSDCPSTCYCQSGVCLPNSGTRPRVEQSVRKPNWIVMIPTIIGIITLCILLIYLHEDYHWPIDIVYFSLIIISISIGVIAYTIIINMAYKKEVEFIGTCNYVQSCNCLSNQICLAGGCCTPQPCENATNCGPTSSNGCGGQCTCPAGQVCYLNLCCTPIETCLSNGECGPDSDLCGGTCNCPEGQTCQNINGTMKCA